MFKAAVFGGATPQGFSSSRRTGRLASPLIAARSFFLEAAYAWSEISCSASASSSGRSDERPRLLDQAMAALHLRRQHPRRAAAGNGTPPTRITEAWAASRRRAVPLLIDHDPSRPIRFVLEVSLGVRGCRRRMGLWASATVTHAPPWLRRRTRVALPESPSANQLPEPLALLDGWVPEVSLVSPACRPVEPRAKVTLIREMTPQQAARTALKPGELHSERGLIRRPAGGAILGFDERHPFFKHSRRVRFRSSAIEPTAPRWRPNR